MIHIGAPYIKKDDTKTKLCSLIQFDGKTSEVYYEVEKRYEEFLCYERADSFLVALLHFAMAKGKDIVSEAPVSEKLYHQLTSYLIPTLAKNVYNKEIKIIVNTNSVDISKGIAVGTGLSSGVDSFHTISTHTKLQKSKYNITHVTFLNVGSHGEGEKAKNLYQKRLSHVKKVADELKLKLVVVNSNISDIVNMDFVKTHTFRSLSAILSLQKLFGVYYYASGYPLDEFKINKDASSANFDLLNVYALSNENIDFYTTGIEASRLDKVKEIATFELSYKYLNVCTKTDINCGECEKCIRTQLELYAINKLQLYGNVFNLNKFNTKLPAHLGLMLANKKNSYYGEIKYNMKKNDINIPYKSYLYAVKPYSFNLLRKSKLIRYIRNMKNT